MRSAATATLALLLVVLAPAGARAEGAGDEARDAARALAAQALKAYEAGDSAAALELFEKADARYPAPQYRIYVARANAKLGKLRKAVAAYDAAVSMPLPAGAPASFAEAQKTASEERAELEKRLATLHVDVKGATPGGATVAIDGEPASADGREVRGLDPGPHRVVVTAGGAEHAISVDLREGAASTVGVSFSGAALEARPSTSRPFRTAAIASGAIGGAGLVLAIATGAVLVDRHATIGRECPNQACSPAGRALIDGNGPIDAANLAGWIVTAAGAAATAAFLIVDHTQAAPTTALVPAVLPGGAGAWLTRRF
jgi:hypothetical protein